MAFNTFKGGIHPPLNKDLTSGKGFSNLAIPQVCYIPLQQHAGTPASPIVNVGDIVQEGQLIAKAEGLISANIHSSVPGKVTAITDHPSAFPGQGECIVIEANGKFSSSGKTREKINWQDYTKETLIEKITEAGIIDMGEEGLPVSAKISSVKDKKIDCLIINGVESEPYLTANDMLMRTYHGEIIEGIRIILKILDIENAYIAVENSKLKAIRALRETIEKFSLKKNIQLYPLIPKYPQESEKQLVYSILKKEVPSGRQLADIGVAILNVAAVFAVVEACVFGKPLFERFVTVTGKIVNKPGNYKIRIGTKISDIIEECEGLKDDPAKIIMGGPMRGIALQSCDVPVTKGTSGIIFFSKREIEIENYWPCIRCGRCVAACPMRLIPCDIEKARPKKRHDPAEPVIFECILCGACSFVCPSKRPLSRFIILKRNRIAKN